MKKRFITLLLAASFLLCSCSSNVDNSAVSSETKSEVTASSDETTESKQESSANTVDDSESSSVSVPETSVTTTEKSTETSEPENTSNNDSQNTTPVSSSETTTIMQSSPTATNVISPETVVTTTSATEKPAPVTTTTAATKKPSPATTTTAATEKPLPVTTTTVATQAPKPVTTTEKPQTTPVVTTTTTTTAKEPIVIPEDAEMSDLTPEQRYERYNLNYSEQHKYFESLKSTLPIIHISTENKELILSRQEYVNCLVDVFNCDEEYELDAEYAGIRIRGNSTAYYGDEKEVIRNQVPYRIKFDKKTNMMGLNDGAECKSWVLLKSQWNLVPDYTAFELAKVIMDGEYYSSDCTYAYVYVNEKFKGLYLLCEQNQINKHRVDLPEHEEGYTGTDIGYFLEIDNYAAENPYWFTMDYCGETLTDLEGTTRQLVPAEYTIKNDIYSQEQADFISEYMSNIYKIMIQAIKYQKYYTFDENYNLIDASNIYDNAYDTINAVVDLRSVVNMYILYEICHDYDCGEGSFYMAIDFSGQSSFKKLTFTAPWDFNWAYSDSATGRYYAGAFNDMKFVNQYGDRTNPWFVLLMGTDWFTELVKEKWNELYKAGEFSAVIKQGVALVNEYTEEFTIKDVSYPENAVKLLKWVNDRIKWLNSQWKN